MNKSRKQTALITGTTSGIGMELSLEFARKGFNLVLVSRNAAELEQQKVKLASMGSVVHTIAIDLSLPQSIQQLMDQLTTMNIQVDALVNNAGFNVSGPFLETNLNQELAMMQLHMQSMVHLTKKLLPGMVQRGQGWILNVGSTGSFTPVPLDAVYGATKAFILSFTEALAAEVKGSGVRVSTLCPGPTNTRFAIKAGIQDTLLFRYGVMSAGSVARKAFEGLMRGKRIIIPGMHNKALVRSIPFTPSCVMAKDSTILLAK